MTHFSITFSILTILQKRSYTTAVKIGDNGNSLSSNYNSGISALSFEMTINVRENWLTTQVNNKILTAI
jgi:hypothetical protein